jgi:hypothetical protein
MNCPASGLEASKISPNNPLFQVCCSVFCMSDSQKDLFGAFPPLLNPGGRTETGGREAGARSGRLYARGDIPGGACRSQAGDGIAGSNLRGGMQSAVPTQPPRAGAMRSATRGSGPKALAPARAVAAGGHWPAEAGPKQARLAWPPPALASWHRYPFLCRRRPAATGRWRPSQAK